jgi:hypothetical protein
MATDRQIEANRRNARLSTGPASKAGRARCAQNARKHGLSSAITHPDARARVDAIATTLVGEHAPADLQGLALVIAEATEALSRASAARCAILDQITVALRRGHASELDALSLKLVRVDRYARRAHARRSRALQDLRAAQSLYASTGHPTGTARPPGNATHEEKLRDSAPSSVKQTYGSLYQSRAGDVGQEASAPTAGGANSRRILGSPISS